MPPHHVPVRGRPTDLFLGAKEPALLPQRSITDQNSNARLLLQRNVHLPSYCWLLPVE